MPTEAKHDIEQDDSYGWVSKSRGQWLVAHGRLDHRMRSATRILVIAEVDESVPPSIVRQQRHARNRRIGLQLEAGLPKHDLCFRAQRTA